MDYFGDPQVAGQGFIEQEDKHCCSAGRSEVLLEGLAVLPDEAVGVVELDHSSGSEERQGSQLIEDLGYVGLVGVELAQTHGPIAALEEGFAKVGELDVAEPTRLTGDNIDAFDCF